MSPETKGRWDEPYSIWRTKFLLHLSASTWLTWFHGSSNFTFERENFFSSIWHPLLTFLKKSFLGDSTYFRNLIDENFPKYIFKNFTFKIVNFLCYIFVDSLYHCMKLMIQNNASFEKRFTVPILLPLYQDSLWSECTNLDFELHRRSST